MEKLIICLFALLLVTGCGNKDQKVAEQSENGSNTVQAITCAKMKQMLDEEKDVVLIDVRSKEEYETQHLSKAINIPNERIKTITENEDITKDTKIIVYCRSGARSKNSANELINMGYKNVYDLGAMSNCSK